jgi:hypothetical protein
VAIVLLDWYLYRDILDHLQKFRIATTESGDQSQIKHLGKRFIEDTLVSWLRIGNYLDQLQHQFDEMQSY